jgi:hypothetical protein
LSFRRGRVATWAKAGTISSALRRGTKRGKAVKVRVDQKARKRAKDRLRQLTSRRWATSRKGYWRIAGSWILSYALPDAYWADQGLKGFSDPYRRFRDAERTAGCGPARPLVWGAPG